MKNPYVSDVPRDYGAVGARVAEAVKLRAEGMSYTQIGANIGVSRERVRRMLHKAAREAGNQARYERLKRDCGPNANTNR